MRKKLRKRGWEWFVLNLALTFRCSRAELLRRFGSSDELKWWRAYFKIYPFEQEREDIRAATVAAAVVNASDKTKQVVGIDKFLPKWEEMMQKEDESELFLEHIKRLGK